MAAHRYHPDAAVNDPAHAVLYDDCLQCTARSADIIRALSELDTPNILELWREMVRVERGEFVQYRTANEARVCRILYAMACTFERIGANPWRDLSEVVG